MHEVNLIFDNPWMCGGIKTLTIHMKIGLEKLGIKVNLIKLANRTEKNLRQYGDSQMLYRNTTIEDVDKSILSIYTHVHFSEPMRTVRMIEHTPNFLILLNGMIDLELNRKVAFDAIDPRRVWTIRRSIAKTMDATFFPHPFELTEGVDTRKTKRICSHCRIAKEKNSHIIVPMTEIDMFCNPREINRLYAYYKQFDERWKSLIGDPVEVIAPYRFDIDLTFCLPGDGGGAQYASLEAMNARCIPVILEEWGQTEFKTIAVPKDANEIRRIIKHHEENEDLEAWADFNEEYLKIHEPSTAMKGICDEYIRRFPLPV